MSRTLSLLATSVLVAGLAVGFSAPAAHADDRVCRGYLGNVHVDGDVVVPQGAKCSLYATRVDGNVKVYRGATLQAKGIRVNGNIEGDNHRWVQVLPRRQDGVRKYTLVGGNIQLKQGGGGDVRRSSVDGDIQLFSNHGRFEVYYNVVDGNLQCKSNDPRPVGDHNRVGGNKEDQCRRF